MVFLPASDIPAYVGEGDIDLGITGSDILSESGSLASKITVDLHLGFGKCKLCLQAPVARSIKDPRALIGGRVATSFPIITAKFFRDLESGGADAAASAPLLTSVRFVSGSVEAGCGLGLADAVVDLVETGTTMKAAGLEVIAEVLRSEAILISNPNSPYGATISTIKQRLEGYITATKYMLISYNVLRTLLPACVNITPGKRSPTITGLIESEICSVSALVLKEKSGEVMDQLQKVGATDILLFSVANSRM